MFKYTFNILVALDQLVNTFLGGEPDETLSSRAWRTYRKGKVFGKIFRPLIDTLLFFDKNHCENAYIAEKRRRQLPPEFRE